MDSFIGYKDNSFLDYDLKNFDQYVLNSPDRNYLKKNSAKNTDRNDKLDSKYRSDEKSSMKKLMSCFEEGISRKLLKSIDNSAYFNCSTNNSESVIDKRMSIRELDARMKKSIKKHKETFTFGAPISYAKVQKEIKKILHRIDTAEDEQIIGFSNEKQK